MKLSQRTVALMSAIGLLVATGAFAQDAPRKLISPVRGEATVDITKPNTKVVGGDVVTVIMVKNTSSAPIAGFKVEENWYDKGGTPVAGDVFRQMKPFMPDEIITVTLKTPRKPSMSSNQYQFSHANGTIKPTAVAKLTPPKTD